MFGLEVTLLRGVLYYDLLFLQFSFHLSIQQLFPKTGFQFGFWVFYKHFSKTGPLSVQPWNPSVILRISIFVKFLFKISCSSYFSLKFFSFSTWSEFLSQTWFLIGSFHILKVFSIAFTNLIDEWWNVPITFNL